MTFFKRYRSARTGRYVTPSDAQANQDTTVTELARTAHDMGLDTTKIPSPVMRALRRSLEVNGLDNTLERLSD